MSKGGIDHGFRNFAGSSIRLEINYSLNRTLIAFSRLLKNVHMQELTVFEMTEKQRHKPFTIEEKLEIYSYKTENPTVPFSDIGTVLN